MTVLSRVIIVKALSNYVPIHIRLLMENFAEQCLDLARSLLEYNLGSINEDGSITPLEGENMRQDEPGHAALALGEFYRATQEVMLGKYNLVDLCARCVTSQVFMEEEAENGLAYAALGLLSFSPAKDRNLVWECLLDPTRANLDRRLLARTDYDNHLQAYNVAKSVARFSLGLSKKDETSKLIDRFLSRLQEQGSSGFCDANPTGFGGVYDINGVMAFVIIRQSLQLHANIHLRERKLPSLRTFVEKYLKIFLDIVRQDGLGWGYGNNIGAYGQIYCISMILQAMRDGWIVEEQKPYYLDILRRLFQFFFMTFLDQEHGVLVIRDGERNSILEQTTRMANFDAARALCQWSRLARSISGHMSVPNFPLKEKGRFVFFQKSSKKEHGLFIYQNPNNGLHLQLPLVGTSNTDTSDSLAFPHCPGVFDWPVNKYFPIMLPELTFGESIIIPSFYGTRCSTGLGLRKAYSFNYEQPDLITKEQKIIPGLGSCKVTWTFAPDKITSEFNFSVKKQIQLDSMRYVLAISIPHSRHRLGTSFTLGAESLRANVIKDDFQASWANPEIVTEDSNYSTYYGKLHYLLILKRDRPLIMQPSIQYKLVVEFNPDFSFIDAL